MSQEKITLSVPSIIGYEEIVVDTVRSIARRLNSGRTVNLEMSVVTQEEIVLSIPSIIGYEEIVVDTVRSIARMKGWNSEKTVNLEMAAVEACVNAIEHGNKEDPAKNVITTVSWDESSIHLSIRDFGEGDFEPDFQEPDFKKQIEERDLRQWGMHTIHSYVDDVKVDSSPGQGTMITMTIHSS